MTDAEKAYAKAEELIANARAENSILLDLNTPETRSLTTLPPEIATLTALKRLDLNNTQVQDISPLATLTALQNLGLSRTQVHDISPLATLTSLIDLYLNESAVTDLRPILTLTNLGSDGHGPALEFENTPATQAFPDLKSLSDMDDWNSRLEGTRTFLRTLPPWPEPLPVDLTNRLPDQTVAAPLNPSLPVLILTPDQKIDVDPSHPTPSDLADPIKSRLYAQLPKAVETLARFGNRYVDLKDAADALRDLTSVPFEEADLLSIHLQLGALTDMRELDKQRRAVERMDADCTAAVNVVLRLGPPITMRNPDVELFEQSLRDYARRARPDTEPQGEREIASDLAQSEDLATDNTRSTASQLGQAPNTGRVAEYRRPFTQNAIVLLATVAGALGDAAVGHVTGGIVSTAAEFLWLHKNAIMAVAPSWGETGYKWAEYILIRCRQIIEEAKVPK